MWRHPSESTAHVTIEALPVQVPPATVHWASALHVHATLPGLPVQVWLEPQVFTTVVVTRSTPHFSISPAPQNVSPGCSPAHPGATFLQSPTVESHRWVDGQGGERTVHCPP